jgi:hypothetical protein
MELSNYSRFIHLSRYSRWIEEKGRRETWEETVDRYCTYFRDKFPDLFPYDLVKKSVLKLEVVPSMRAVMTAGPALDRDNIAGYNCSFVAVDHPRAFDEIMYILMCGTGVGFSVEEQHVRQLPTIEEKLVHSDSTIAVADSRIGWASALREHISLLYSGKIARWDLSKVRPAGARLKTFGGRASGPDPLDRLFKRCVEIFTGASGRKLTSLECHDLVCSIADVVIVGGVRRSALISLSDLTDSRLRNAKTGQWWIENPERALANNSAVYDTKPDFHVFLEEWKSLYESKSGERGIFNREAAIRHIGGNGRRQVEGHAWGTNPCGEIYLRPSGLCNLTEIIVRPTDTIDSLRAKVTTATILGTFQSTLTNFRYLRKQWQRNAEEERLLGVSFTGIFDNKLLRGELPTSWVEDVDIEGRTITHTPQYQLDKVLEELRNHAVKVNKDWSDKLGIQQSAGITCVKPSGCRPGDALVTTHKGIYTLDELNPGTGTRWADLSGVNSHAGKVTKFYNNGTASVYQVNLNFGMSLKSTPNHQWSVGGEWKRTDQLEPGDIIDIVPGQYCNYSNADLVDVPNPKCNSTPITMPRKIDTDLAWLLGYLWGDGCLSPHKWRIRFTDQNVCNLDKAAKILKSLFNLSAEIHPASEARDAYVLEKGSHHLWNWLISNGFWKYRPDGGLANIPVKIRESSPEVILSFFAGWLDADGHYKDGKAVISTADAQFAEHAQNIAWSVGLCLGRSHNTGGSNLQANKSMWLMNVSSNTREATWDIIQEHSNKVTGFLSRKKANQYGVIQSVDYIGELETYDVETEEHWFYAGAVKSHNTVSQLAGCSSGIHPSYSPYYLRTVRLDTKDPLCSFLKDSGVYSEPEQFHPETQQVFYFPTKAPEGSITNDNLSALEHFKLYLTYRKHWCEHNPSTTIYYTDDEFLSLGDAIWNNWDDVGGISFLPRTDHVYKQAPYIPITEEKYNEEIAKFPQIDWQKFHDYEKEDATKGTQELACQGNSCELVI